MRIPLIELSSKVVDQVPQLESLHKQEVVLIVAGIFGLFGLFFLFIGLFKSVSDDKLIDYGLLFVVLALSILVAGAYAMVLMIVVLLVYAAYAFFSLFLGSLWFDL